MSEYRSVRHFEHPEWPVDVVEDEQGLRWLACNSQQINLATWRLLQRDTFAGVISTDGPDVWSVVDWETFTEHATPQDEVVTSKGWRTTDHTPSLADLTLPAPVDDELPGWVNLHCHGEMSLLDGLSTATEIVESVVSQGGKYAALTDHGNVAGHPDLQKACDLAGIKPVFGIEAYLVDDRFKRLEHFEEPAPLRSEFPTAVAHTEATRGYKERRAEYVSRLRDYWHLVLIATTQEGLRNVWSASTESFQDGLYGKNPRMDWDTLRKHSEGVIATTACLRGPLWHKALEDGDEGAARARLAKLMEIFPGRLYVEIHANQLPQQRVCNEALVKIAREYDLPLVAAADSHYTHKDQQDTHDVWLAVQTNRDEGDDSTLFADKQDYHMLTEQEMRSCLSYLPQDVVDEAIANTGVIAAQATARIEGKPTPPVFSKGGIPEDDQRLLDLCLSNWGRTEGKRYPAEDYIERFEREFSLIKKKKFSGYFLMTADMTNYARGEGILVGPGRGSGGGSLVAYLASITDIDPVDADLLFERFMTEGRTELPDFDIDYPASKKQEMQRYVRERYGENNVTVVGSILRLKNKGVIDKVAKVLKSTLPDDFAQKDQKALRTIIENAEADTAGLGLSWDDLISSRQEEFEPYIAAYPQLFQLCGELVGRANTFGQHAAGMVISTAGSLTDNLPLRRAKEDGHMIAQFDKDVLEQLGFVKFDMLTLRNLDTIQDTIDLIKQRRDVTINPYEWREEYEDPQVWSEICDARTLGLFQIETTLGTRYAALMGPTNLAELADLVTIVRPGPRNSKLTDVYLRRRHGKEEVSYPDPRLTDTLGKTHGVILYQEDIMATMMLLAGFDSTESDKVRKILGKKKVDQIAAAGQDFIERSVQMGMERSSATALWAQMAEFARYSFNRSHAYAYAMLCYWTAWFKFHFPGEFLTAALSTVDSDNVPAFVVEARRMGYRALPPDINDSKTGFTFDQLTIRYGLEAVKGVGVPTADAIVAGQPYASYEDFVARMVTPKHSPVNAGVLAILVRIGAFDSLISNRRGVELSLAADKSGDSARCIFKVDTIPVGAPNNLPCTFDWDSEPAPVNPRNGKTQKRKAPPKKCTKACRNYTPPPPLDPDTVEPYTAADIRDIETEMLGLCLSSTPFEVLPDEVRQEVNQNAELATTPNGPQGDYLLVGILSKKRPYTDATGRQMGFLGFDTEKGSIDVTSFSTTWGAYTKTLTVGGLYVVEASRNDRGFTLAGVEKID